METTPSGQPKPPGMVAIVCGVAGFALLSSAACSFIACAGGFLFSGLSAGFVIFQAAGVSALIASVAAAIFRRRRQYFGWRTLLVTVSACTIVAVSVLSYLDTRQQMRIIMTNSPLPSGLRVHHGTSFLFSSYVHFTGPPATIASLLRSKGLLEIPAEPPDSSDHTAFGNREQSKKKSWGWWQPTSMPGARFYFLHHESKAVQGWSEGWWVSGATNEVYAFISG